MEDNRLTISDICSIYDVPQAFIDSLREFELVEIVEDDNDSYIMREQIDDLERLMRLHFDLNVNIEGLDVINNLLKKIEYLQKEVNILKNRLDFYEV